MNYEEKLRLAKEALESGSYDKETIEYIFPELKESEEEKTRKEIIDTIHRAAGNSGVHISEFLENKYIAWLEKQGEQKPAWSEEDENVLEDIEEAIINYWHGDTQDIILEWLKSLKERMKGE